MIHPRAEIHPTAQVHPTAIIGPNVLIEEGVHIGAYAVIGTHAEHSAADVRQPVLGHVRICRRTVVREHVTIHASAKRDGCTFIGEDCLVQAHAHIGHDACVGDHVTIACFACVGGHAVVKDHANLGLHAVLHQFAEVGEGAMVGAGAFAKGKLEPFTTYVGVPAKAIGANHRKVRALLEMARTNPADPA